MAAKKKAEPKAKAVKPEKTAAPIVINQDTPPPATVQAVDPVPPQESNPAPKGRKPRATKPPVVTQPAPEAAPVTEPVVLQRDKPPHANASEVADLFKQIREGLTASEGARQSRPLRWALKSLAMAEETAARHFSLL